MTSYQQHERGRERLRLRRMELENRALEHFANALGSSTCTIDRLHALSIDREQAITPMYRGGRSHAAASPWQSADF